MSLFHRNKHTEAPKESADAQQTSAEVQQSKEPTAEEIAQQWWSQKYGEPMPEEVREWMRQLTRTEARQQNIATSLLSPLQLQQAEEAKRLAETKMKSLETSMQKVRQQEDWIRKFDELTQDMNSHNSHLYECNKKLAISANEEKELERFETFETVQGIFLRMKQLEELSRNNKTEQSNLTRELEEAQRQVQEEQKLMAQKDEALSDAAKQMETVGEQLNEAHRILGARNIIDLDLQSMESSLKHLSQRKETLEKKIAEEEEQAAETQKNLTQLKTQRQTLEPHQRMFRHGKQALLRLDMLHDTKDELDSLERELEEQRKKQHDENEALNQIFTQYQNLETEIQTQNSEMQMHRQSIAGTTSYSLQERAMKLKSRRQMLTSAQALWVRIQTGYQFIEEKSLSQNALRLNIEGLENNLKTLTEEVDKLTQSVKEKEYTLTVGKSQNVIQLRADLMEGMNCVVCGSTHHPYHSDTMLEQNKLISELRSEYETEKVELQNKEKQLLELRLTLKEQTTKYKIEEEYLTSAKTQQDNDVKAWSMYAELDRSFADCSPSTNQEARASMIRQLIENSIHDADEAQHELDIYNYHQTCINDILESLSKKEQEKSELTVRLNETNTGCQVMNMQVERMQQERARLRGRYTQVYEGVNKNVTLNEWFKEWEESHEGLKQRITDMLSTWENLTSEIGRLEFEQKNLASQLEINKTWKTAIEANIQKIQEDIEKRTTLRKEGEQNYERTLGNKETKEFYDANVQTQKMATKEVGQQRIQFQQAALALARIEARLQELQEHGKAFDAESVNMRSQLDIWMRQYNANHPPVQYNELEDSFAQDKDWNALRKQVRETRIEATIEQSLVEKLRNQVVDMQAYAAHNFENTKDQSLGELEGKMEQLTAQYQEAALSLAEQDIALRKHEQCKVRLESEKKSLQDLADK